MPKEYPEKEWLFYEKNDPCSAERETEREVIRIFSAKKRTFEKILNPKSNVGAYYY